MKTLTAFAVGGTDLRGKERLGRSVQVRVACSYSYNGGTVVKGVLYSGYDVAPPIIPDGYVLVDIGIGLCLNSHPPMATKILRIPRSN